MERCINCSILTEKETKIWCLPEILILRLYKDESIKNKVVSFPMELEMKEYVHCQSPDKQGCTIYTLYGMAVHIGKTYNSGHFVSKVRNLASSNDLWHIYNDTEVHKCMPEDVMNTPAYNLFYQKRPR